MRMARTMPLGSRRQRSHLSPTDYVLRPDQSCRSAEDACTVGSWVRSLRRSGVGCPVADGFAVSQLCWFAREDMLHRPVQRDLFAEFEALQCWRYALQLYNGIEIAFKHLCMLADPSLDPKEFGHKLTRAFDAMPLRDREHIEEHFAQYLSLLCGYRLGGQEITTAREFVRHVSDTDPGIGSIQWRYMPLEGMEGLPQLDLWGMLEIWQAAACRIMQHHKPSSPRCGSSPGQQITMSLARLMPPEVHPTVSADDLNEWIDRMHLGSSLAAYVDVLAKGHRQAM